MDMTAMTGDTVKVFTSGNSQAIRLPKKFRLAGRTAHITHKGKSLVITPDEDAWARFDRGMAGLAGLWEGFDRGQPKNSAPRRDIFP